MEQDMSNYKIVNGERILMTSEEEALMFDASSRTPQYIANRTNSPEATNRDNAYPGLASQLDILWHDIDEGLFGDQAKTGDFYLTLKNVKTSNPKT